MNQQQDQALTLKNDSVLSIDGRRHQAAITTEAGYD